MKNQVTVIDPSERVWRERNLQMYSCGKCNFTVSFEEHNFLVHRKNPKSNLSKEINDLFDAARPLQLSFAPNTEENEYFLDFSCECDISVRIIYTLKWTSVGKCDFENPCIAAVVECEAPSGKPDCSPR